MKLINQSAEYLPQQAGIDGIYKQIELAGRTSYLSWDKMVDVVSFDLSTLPKNITIDDIPDYKLHPKECIKFLNDNKISYHVVDSSKKFVDMLIKSKHTSVLEHGTVYLRLPLEYKGHYTQKGNDEIWNSELAISKYHLNSYSIVNTVTEDMYLEAIGGGKYLYPKGYYITTNLRVLQENGWLDDLQYLCEPTKFHEKRLTVKLTTSIDITRESNRNRVLSPTEESTRYCNYSKGKYDNSISVGIPSWVNEEEIPTYKGLVGFADDISNDRTDRWDALDWWFFANLACEKSYMMLLDKGWTPQQARKVLPLGTKSEIAYTAFESDWRDWFDKRLFGKTGEPHPDMLVLANLIKQEFEKAGVWEGIMKYPSKYE